MMFSLRLGYGLLLGTLLWTAVGPTAGAQDSHTLTIRDGGVYVDGRQLAPDQIPEQLDLEGVTARYRFVGIQQPVIELDGQLYALDDGLRPVSEDEVNAERSSVILQEVDARPTGPRRSGTADQNQYLNDVQQANRELYERLVREKNMEQRAQELARLARMLPPDSPERQEKTDSLRTLLNDIFALKQENRRQEIERLQREIQELQRSLQKRSQMREEMIERRLTQLLDTARD